MRRRLPLIVAGVLAVAAAAAAVAWWAQADRGARVTRATVDGAGVRLDTRTWVPAGVDADDPAPAVLLTHGLGEDQDDVRGLARRLARAGYIVRTWSSRGSGESTGRVGVAAPDGEVADVSRLVDGLAERDDVRHDAPGDPRVAVVGTSHGGGVAMLASAADERIDVVVPMFAWYDLDQALEPNGVLKLRWASELFAVGAGLRDDDPSGAGTPCGRLTDDACDAWRSAASAGRLTPDALAALERRSPASAGGDLRAPTLVVQGQMDSLFGFDQAVQLAQALERNRAPVRVEWVRGGHDLPLDRRRREHVEEAVVRWLDRHLRGRGSVDAGPRFSVELGAGRGHAHAPRIPPKASPYRLALEPAGASDDQGFVRFAAPPGGLPAHVTTLPGLGDMTGVEQGFEAPANQRARLRAPRVEEGVEIIGTPRVRLSFTGSQPDGIVFVRLVDVAKGGRRIVPRGLVTPLRLDGLPPLGSERGRAVTVELPAIAWRLAPGHHLEVEVTSTDAGYVAPPAAMSFGVSAPAGQPLVLPEVREPRRTPDTFDAGRDWRDLLVLAALLLGVAVVVGLLVARAVRRRDARVQEPSLRDTPISARDLVKRFGDGRVAVDRLSFTVHPGTVVGLVGPNGAGKTTVLRMLLGLVHPSDGFAHAFGQRIRPGIPNLARIGAMVEGPGLIPHLTGRQHLRRYWSASGRPGDVDIDAALAAVDLTRDADRPVRTWSHGMRQRLGIAQALLGSPPLVVLDEPANGLDPAQIAQLRSLIRDVADSGRAVLLSSHLLDELERVCTHVVLMSEGRVLRSGTLADVVDGHADLEAAFLALVAGDRAEVVPRA